MSQPLFYVIARIVGAPGTFKKWEEVLVPLCEVSLTEQKGISYYWSRDLDGEADTIWGLEGYTDAGGFYEGHPSSDVFATQMAIIDSENLLAEDYDLKHYDFAGGWLKRPGDPEADSKLSHVAVLHFFAREGVRDEVICLLESLGKLTLDNEPKVSSFAILRELNDKSLVTVWLRTPSSHDFQAYSVSKAYQEFVEGLKDKVILEKSKLHQSKAFNGHLNK